MKPGVTFKNFEVLGQAGRIKNGGRALFVFLRLAVVSGLCTECATIANAAATYSSSIAISGYTRNETLTNFPVLVNITNVPGFVATQAHANGYDVRFWSDAACSSALNAECESFDTTNKIFWVQVPALTAGTTIYASWGDPSLTTLPVSWTNGSTWATTLFAAVFHFTTASQLTDSTVYQTNAVLVGTAPAYTNGAAGRGIQFNNATVYSNRFGTVSNEYTISLWGRWTSTANMSFFDSLPISGSRIILAANPEGVLGGKVGIYRDQFYTAGSGLNSGSLHQLVQTSSKASNANRLYVDSAFMTTCAQGGQILGVTGIGGRYSADSVRVIGMMDECRIYKMVCSTNWVFADYMTIASNSIFQVYSTVSRRTKGTTIFFY